MNDQSEMMNQPPQIMMNAVQVQFQVPVQPQMLNQSHQLMASAAHSQAMNQFAAAQSQPISSGPQMMTQPPPPMMLNRSYKPWQFQDPNPNPKPNKKFSSFNRNNNWKGKKVSFGKDSWKFENKPLSMGSGSAVSSVPAAPGSNTQGYKPPTLNDLQNQNRLKARKFYGNKKKFNYGNNRFAPYAPRNTTSFIIRAKKSGGIASLVSPCPVTPAVLPTPMFSPSREVLGDMAKEEWGVDGYGSMKGLIRLRSPETGHEDEEEEDGENGGDSSESDVEEHVEVERRLDHDLSRFEMIYPSYGGDYNNVLENRVDDQDTHIAQLEEENLTLKERLFLMERELGDLRRRLQFLERQSQIVEDVNEEVVENGSDNESEDRGSDLRVVTSAAAHNNVEMLLGFAAENTRNVDVLENNNGGMPQNEILMDVFMEDIASENELSNEGKGNYELMPVHAREGIIRDKENDAKGDESRGVQFVEERTVEEDTDVFVEKTVEEDTDVFVEKTVEEDKDEFVEEKTVREDEDKLRCEETSNEAAENTETK